jgi:lysozyme
MSINRFGNRSSRVSVLGAVVVVLGFCGLLLPQQPVMRKEVPATQIPEMRAPAANLPRLKAPGTQVYVAKISGENLADGEAELGARHLVLGTVEDQLADPSKVDVILSQNPPPATMVAPGSSVSVQVGVTIVIMPDLKGRPLQEAEKMLAALHLDVGRVTPLKGPGASSPGQVIAFSPPAGSKVQSHHKVEIEITGGSAKVPDLAGKGLFAAQALLTANNLTLGTVIGQPFRIDSSNEVPPRVTVVPNTVSDWSPKGPVPVGAGISLSFPGASTFVNDRVVRSLPASEMVKAVGKVPKREFPSIDRVTSVELLSNLEARTTGRGTMMMMMAHVNLPPILPDGTAATEKFEGWVPYLYNDSAKYCTIGFGHLIDKSPCNGSEPYQNGLTMPAGVNLLQQDMYSAHLTVYKAVTVKLTDGQTAALTDFVFNVGSANFRNSSLLRAINGNQGDDVPAQFRRWVYARGKKWPGLVERREGEITLYYLGMMRTQSMIRRRPELENLPPIDIQQGEGH